MTLVPVDRELAARSALMAGLTRSIGASPGDRICLALGQRTGQVVLTADKSWLEIADTVGVSVELIG